jgi:hypothetical protein
MMILMRCICRRAFCQVSNEAAAAAAAASGVTPEKGQRTNVNETEKRL